MRRPADLDTGVIIDGRAGSIIRSVAVAILGLSLAACSTAQTGRTSGGGLSALKANLSLDELTERAPLVVDALVLSTASGLYRDHPDLKATLTVGEKRMVDAGLQYVEWRLRVEGLVKGASSPEIVARTALGGPMGITDVPTFERGQRYRFWLEPGQAYMRSADYILVRGERLPLPLG